MKTVVLNSGNDFIKALHMAVCRAYGCGLNVMYSSSETLQIKTAVFLLNHFYGFTPREISPWYDVAEWRVEAFIASVKEMYAYSGNYQLRIKQILDNMDATEEYFFKSNSDLLNEILKC